MTAPAHAPRLPGHAPQLGDENGTSAPSLLDQVVDMSDYLKSIENPQALKNQKALAAAYDKAVHELIGENDVQTEGGREFKKKSAWKKLARHFRIDVMEKSHNVVRTEDGNTIAEVIMIGVAPWGQKVEEIGACTTYEKRFKSPAAKMKGWHDCLATAQTRASNRVISALIAAGEVSAEEVEAEQRGAGEQGESSADAVFPFGELKGLPPTDGAVHLEALVYAIGWCSATEEKREKFGAFIDGAWKAIPEKIAATADDQLLKVHKWASTPKRADAWLALTKETGDAIHARGLDHEPKPKDATTGTVLEGQKQEEAEQLAAKLNPAPASAEGNAPAATDSTPSSAPVAAARQSESTTPASVATAKPSTADPLVEAERAQLAEAIKHPACVSIRGIIESEIPTMNALKIHSQLTHVGDIIHAYNVTEKKREQGRSGMAARKANEAKRAAQAPAQPSLSDTDLDDALGGDGNPFEDGLDDMGNPK